MFGTYVILHLSLSVESRNHLRNTLENFPVVSAPVSGHIFSWVLVVEISCQQKDSLIFCGICIYNFMDFGENILNFSPRFVQFVKEHFALGKFMSVQSTHFASFFSASKISCIERACAGPLWRGCKKPTLQ